MFATRVYFLKSTTAHKTKNLYLQRNYYSHKITSDSYCFQTCSKGKLLLGRPVFGTYLNETEESEQCRQIGTKYFTIRELTYARGGEFQRATREVIFFR